MDWAEASRILGVPESATDAERKEQYLYKAQVLHPDKNQDRPENIRKKAEAELALINQAYHFLNEPLNNPYKIPPRLAIHPMRIRFRDMSPGQKKTTSIIIKNVGGPYTSIWLENQPAPWLSVTEVKSLTSERLPLEVTIECTASGEANKPYYCELPVKLENENTRMVERISVGIEFNIRSDFSNWQLGTDLKNVVKKSAAEPVKDPNMPQPVKLKKMGFSFGSFILDLLGFGVLGMTSIYAASAFLSLSETVLMTGITVFTALGFGASLNHGFTVHSEEKKKKKK